MNKTLGSMHELKISKFLFADVRMAWLWLIVRLYIGWEWLVAGWDKLIDPNGLWAGAKAGVAVSGFLQGALNKTTGAHPDVSGWYAYFIQNFALPNATLFSYAVTYGEILVGAALILGLMTGKAAFWGVFMNVNYLLAGTVSVNPQMFILGLLLIMAWRTAGWYGLDRYILPRFFNRYGNLFVS